MNKKYFETGVSEAVIDDICHVLQINIVVYFLTNKIWYERKQGEKYKTFIVLDHNCHFTDFKPNFDSMPGLDVKITKIGYPVDVQDTYLNDPTPIKYPILNNDKSIIAYCTEKGIMYKRKDIFYDEDD